MYKHLALLTTLIILAICEASAGTRTLSIVCPPDPDLQRSRVVARIQPAQSPLPRRIVVRCGEPDAVVTLDPGDIVQLVVRVVNTRLGMIVCREAAPDWLASRACVTDLGMIEGALQW